MTVLLQDAHPMLHPSCSLLGILRFVRFQGHRDSCWIICDASHAVSRSKPRNPGLGTTSITSLGGYRQFKVRVPKGMLINHGYILLITPARHKASCTARLDSGIA